jgi:hypothetical protein
MKISVCFSRSPPVVTAGFPEVIFCEENVSQIRAIAGIVETSASVIGDTRDSPGRHAHKTAAVEPSIMTGAHCVDP